MRADRSGNALPYYDFTRYATAGQIWTVRECKSFLPEWPIETIFQQRCIFQQPSPLYISSQTPWTLKFPQHLYWCRGPQIKISKYRQIWTTDSTTRYETSQVQVPVTYVLSVTTPLVAAGRSVVLIWCKVYIRWRTCFSRRKWVAFAKAIPPILFYWQSR